MAALSWPRHLALSAMSRWTHADGTTEHEADPKYNGSGWMNGETPSYWICHAKGCGRALKLDGAKVPITAPVKNKRTAESKMSQQP